MDAGDENIHSEYDYLSKWQYLTAFAVGCLSSTLSLIGSSMICYLVLNNNNGRKRKVGELYHRLLLGLSLMDIFTTTSVILLPFFQPSWTGWDLAMGNTTTCEISGFLIQYFMGSFIYSTELSVYFYLIICRNKREQDVTKLMEPYVHILPVLVPTIIGIYCLLTGHYNPDPVFAFCSINGPPPGCVEDDGTASCGRAKDFVALGYTIQIFSLFLVAVGIICTWLVYWKVRNQTQLVRRHSFIGLVNLQQEKRTKMVGMQAVWYTAAYMNGFLVFMSYPFVPRDTTDRKVSYRFVLMIVLYMLFPLQGFFNCIVYMRPGVMRWKEREPSLGLFWAIRQTISGKSPPPQPLRRPAPEVFAADVSALETANADGTGGGDMEH